MENSKIFVFPEKERIATVDVEDLEKSVIIRNPRSNDPGPTRPLQHWQLLRKIHEMAKLNSLEIEQKEIWVEKSNSVRMSTKEEDREFNWNESNTPLNKWLFDHVIARIGINPRNTVDGFNPEIAIAYTKRGIKVVWGLNVHVCSNLSIFGENMLSTYGSSKMPFLKQLEVLENWMMHVENKFLEDVEITRMMQKKKINERWINETVGDLYVRAINKAYKQEKNAPVNTSILSTLVQKMNWEDVKTIWDFYNAGTNIINPGNIIIEDILDTNISWGKYLVEKV